MRMIILATMVGISAASGVGAEPHTDTRQAGHWEWKTPPSYGPRAPLPVSHRVWVPDRQDQAAGDRVAMHKTGGICMHSKKPKAG